MKVLYITQGFPGPQMVGGQISSFYRIVQFVRAGHEVTAICLVPRAHSDTPPDEISKIARIFGVRDVPRASLRGYALNLVDPLPWPIRRYASKEAAARIQEVLHGDAFDLIFFNSVHSATLLEGVRRTTGAPCVLFAPNVQSTVMELYYRFQSNPLVKTYAFLQWRKMLAFERRASESFDLVFVYSENDVQDMLRVSPRACIARVPLMLDIGSLAGGEEREAFDILFVGSFGWAPNRDSLRWFLDEILPEIRARRPDTTVAVVGSGAPRWVLALEKDPAIHIYGQVDDALPYFRRARVIVVPLRIGSGIRVKIVQALAARRTVVTTSKGCEGLAVNHGEHLIIADQPEEFAEATVQLLESPEERKALGERGHELVARVHDALSPRPPLVLACERLARSTRRPV